MQNGLRARARWVGLVCAVLVPGTIVAAFVQHRSRLPGRYSWRFSSDLLWDLVREPWFPVFACAAAAIGFSRRGSLAAPIRAAGPRRRAIALAVGIVAAAIAAWRVSGYEPIDLACLGLLAGYAALLPRPSAKEIPRALAEGVFTFGAYLVASYAHTVGKALMLVHPARDVALIAAERALFGTPIHELLTTWTRNSPVLLAIASRLYRTQTDQMMLYTLMLTCAAERRLRREFVAAIAILLVVGAPLYHVLPCVGPFFAHPEQYRHLARVDLVTNWYGWLAHNTVETVAGRSGELLTYQYVAAMPSLHVGFTAPMVYVTWRWPILRVLSLVLVLVTWTSTMVLGWHYFLDGVVGLTLAALVIVVVRRCAGALLPAPIQRDGEVASWPRAPTLPPAG
jgi:hypothetical protein